MLTKQVIIQPIDLCNLNCTYCYLPGRKNTKLMSSDILEKCFKVLFSSSFVCSNYNYSSLSVVWHAGEPMLAGIDFYKRAKELQLKYNSNKLDVRWEMQTNATRVTQEWCDFINTCPIVLGVSLDGPENIHDQCRVNWNGKGSFKLVMRGVELLRKNNIPLRAICVLTNNSLDYPNEIYDFFKNNHFETLCFNIDEQEGVRAQSSMSVNGDLQDKTSARYRRFMSIVYDRWLVDGCTLKIREFSRTLRNIKYLKKYGLATYVPNMESAAFSIVTISKDGDVTTYSPELSGGVPGDSSKFVIGNVLAIESLDELESNENFQEQLDQVKQGIKMCADQCEYFSFCGGGSPSNKFYENGSFASTETSFCILGQKVLFDVVMEKLS